MSFKSEVEDALLELEGELAEDGVSPLFDWYGAQIPCVPTSLQRVVEIQPDGNPIIIDARLFVRADHFVTADSTEITVDQDDLTVDSETPFPKSGHTLTFRGTIYRVSSVKLDSSLSHVEMSLESTSV